MYTTHCFDFFFGQPPIISDCCGAMRSASFFGAGASQFPNQLGIFFVIFPLYVYVYVYE